MTADYVAHVAAMTEAEVTAIAYEEAADGDSARALCFAVEDILTLEGRLSQLFEPCQHCPPMRMIQGCRRDDDAAWSPKAGRPFGPRRDDRNPR